MTTPEPRPIDLNVPMLTEPQAYALARFCKQVDWTEALRFAVDDDEARLMIQAVERVRGALEQVGVSVR